MEWRSRDRLEHPSGRQNLIFPANYPGVDYMLLHNLYYEYLNQEDDAPGPAEAGAYKNAYNLMDNYDEQTWPMYGFFNPPGVTPPQWYLIGVNASGTVQNPIPPGQLTRSPAKIKLFQNLTSRAQINPATGGPYTNYASAVEYRAGKDITLLPEQGGQPGFHVTAGPGSDFHAYIQRYVCNGDNDPLARQNPNDPNYRSNDYESDEMNTEFPIHHVYSPPSPSDLYPNGSSGNETLFENLEEMQSAILQEYQSANLDASGVSAIQNEISAQRFTILPNPNNGHFKLLAARMSDEESFTYRIMDMKGQCILQESDLKSNINKDIDISELSEGIYLVHLHSSLGHKMIKKVTVIK